MNDNKTKPTKDELIAQLPTAGWEIKPDKASQDQTLEEAVRAAHSKHKSGEGHGTISHIKTAIELDLIELQLLWEHLGLPM